MERRNRMKSRVAGHLLVIGGNEDKTGECLILRAFVRLAGGHQARIAILTTATELPKEVGAEYRTIFERLGAGHVTVLYADTRLAASSREVTTAIGAASGIFLTGGDQLRLTSILGGSEADRCIMEAFCRGVVVAGTSAGASAMAGTMIVSGDSADTATRSAVSMAQGMGLVEGVVIDQHFAQRGRMNRLLAAVAQNPHLLGIGIDEDTAILVRPNGQCEVIGSQSVTILDGRQIRQTNVSDSMSSEPLAITNLTMHVLPTGFGYDLAVQKPYRIAKQEATSCES